MTLLSGLRVVLVVERLTQLLLAASVALTVRGGAHRQIKVWNSVHLSPRPQTVSEHYHTLFTVEDVEVTVSTSTGVQVVLLPQEVPRLAVIQGDGEAQRFKLVIIINGINYIASLCHWRLPLLG